MGAAVTTCSTTPPSCCRTGEDKEIAPVIAKVVDDEAKPVLDEPVAGKAAERVQEAEKANSGDPEWTITLDRAIQKRIGIDVDHAEQKGILVVRSITGGLAEQWNSANPDAQVRAGDHIVDVNGAKGDVGVLLERCRKDKLLRITLKRTPGV
mmetsp:Transcript_18140/g.42125  ORF Transcript_18140/g.42125 Transcript_18140/m.42125 type:complete len:152 (-) Transcript_18140:267-722(-)